MGEARPWMTVQTGRWGNCRKQVQGGKGVFCYCIHPGVAALLGPSFRWKTIVPIAPFHRLHLSSGSSRGAASTEAAAGLWSSPGLYGQEPLFAG